MATPVKSLANSRGAPSHSMPWFGTSFCDGTQVAELLLKLEHSDELCRAPAAEAPPAVALEVADNEALVQSFRRMCEFEALEVDLGCPETLLAEFKRLTDGELQERIDEGAATVSNFMAKYEAFDIPQ